MASHPAPRSSDVTRLRRYALYQLPGIAALLLGVAALWPWLGLPRWSALAGSGAWVVKDIAMYPFVKEAYEPPVAGDPANLFGRDGVVARALAPAGYAKLGGEPRKACVSEGSEPLVKGRAVKVIAVDGLTLTVVPNDGEAGS